MDSDSDATIIIDSDDEIMDVEVSESNVVPSPVTSQANPNSPEVNEDLPEALSPTLLRSDFAPSGAVALTIPPEDKQTPTQCNDSSNDEDGATCPICMDSWTSYGDHRICALKCGHLFGRSCILRWFSQKQYNCPTCKKKADKSQIRKIYARKLIAIDTSEYENIKKQYEEVNKKNLQLQLDVSRNICRQIELLDEVKRLKSDAAGFKCCNKKPLQHTAQLNTAKSLEICKEGGCRVLDHCVRSNLIVASVKSTLAMFPGFGIRKIDFEMYKPTGFIPLHTKTIRDVTFHPQNPWLLSVSLDKTINIIDITSNMCITNYTKGEVALWSCCWDVSNSNVIYVGTQQGSVTKFDLRNMQQPVTNLITPDDNSPVVGSASLPLGSLVTRGSLIVCKLNSLWVFENESSEPRPLALEGPFISMKYQHSTNHLLVTARPNSQHHYARHLVCTLASGENNLLCNVVHQFQGSSTQKLMSRSCFAADVYDSYVAAYHESNKIIQLWSVRNGLQACSVTARDPILDLCSFNAFNTNYFVSLSEKKIDIFKFM